MTDFRKWAFVGLMSLGLVSVGCGSSGNSGTGGSNGSGGSTNKGGSTGSGGATNKGGSTGSGSGGTSASGSGGTSATGSGGAAGSAVACGSGTTSPPAAALITDFSDAVTAGADAGTPGKITFGSSSTVQGGIATFQNPASTAGTTMVTGGNLVYTATVSAAGTASADMYPYSGFVVYINGPACVDASAYTGVSFTISGNIGTCGLVFSFNDAEHGAAGTADARFTGASGAYAPQLNIASMVSTTSATIMVPFNDSSFANGSPAFSGMADSMNLTGVQWQFTQSNTSTATCTGTITVGDVTFYH